jgi:hypothetical protein
MSRLATELKHLQNFTYTENGALTHVTTQNGVLDYFALGGGKRHLDTTSLFSSAFAEDRKLAVAAAFHCRDIRGGQGERKVFREAMTYLADAFPETFIKIFKEIPEYGYWKDLMFFATHSNVGKEVTDFILNQLKQDTISEHPSVLGKWMPSANTSSRKSRALAMHFINSLGVTPKTYRKMLVGLRAKLNLVETNMSAGKFDQIEYSHVPSIASKNYRKAFFKKDEARYREFLGQVKKGEKKINAGTLYPYDIVGQYLSTSFSMSPMPDETLEALWNALPNYADDDSNSLVMVDVSQSMFDGLSPSAAQVAISLGLYIAERNKGLFKNHFLTFTSNSHLQEIKGKTLWERIKSMRGEVGYSTNLEGAFDGILRVAIKNNLPPEEMPKNVFIVSDGEFNPNNVGKTTFSSIADKFTTAGYEMPQLISWNVRSRGQKVPVEKDANGVFLVSGCSPSIFKSAVQTKTVTPIDLMVEVLSKDRYQRIQDLV